MLSKDEIAKRRLAAYDYEVVDIDEEARRLVALLKGCREGLAKDVSTNPGGMITEKQMKTLKDLTAAFNSATDCVVRLDKTAADRAKKMTQADYLRAAQRLVCSLDRKDSEQWIEDTVKMIVGLLPVAAQ